MTKIHKSPTIQNPEKPVKAAVFSPNGIHPGVFYYGDNLKGMQKLPDNSIDLIYLDPPFNSKKQWSGVIEDGGKQTAVAFKDTWSLNDIKQEWVDAIGETKKYEAINEVAKAANKTAGESAYAYILYMAIRLLEMHRILKDTGSIYYHCDPVMSHSVKLLMDAIFGIKNFQNEIIWSYRRWSGVAKKFQQMHDVVLFYTKDSDADYTWNTPMEPKAEGTPKYKRWNAKDKDGIMRTYCDKSVVVPDTNMRDVWEIPRLQSKSKERVGYPTQKPEPLIERAILASSNPGDVVFDPFAGSGTTCYAAAKNKRHYIGMDLNRDAAKKATSRLKAIKEGKSLFVSDDEDVASLTKSKVAIDINNAAGLERKSEKSDAYRRRLAAIALQKQYGRCLGCGEWSASVDGFDCDHIEPKSRGGLLTEENTQALCGNCNSIKGNRTMAYLWNKLDKDTPFENEQRSAGFWRLAYSLIKKNVKAYGKESFEYVKNRVEGISF